MAKQFASQGDLSEKRTTIVKLSERAYAYTAEGDPNSGIVIGDESVMVVDAQATPGIARDLIGKLREFCDKPISHLLLSHYHALRVMGASAFGGAQIIASRGTKELIDERGQADFDSEVGRFPRLFAGVEEVPGLTHPDVVVDDELEVDLGNCVVKVFSPGAGHTKGDTIAWLEDGRVLFAGDLVEHGATPYCGDAQLAQWPATLERLRAMDARAVVPGRGSALADAATIVEGFDGTESFVTQLLGSVAEGRERGKDLGEIYREVYPAMESRFGGWVIFEHCMPFNVSRAFDEAGGIEHPRIWTAQRDREMWEQLA